MKQPFNLELEVKISDTVARKYLLSVPTCLEYIFHVNKKAFSEFFLFVHFSLHSRFNREHPEKNHEKWFQTLFFVTSLAIPLLCILCFYLNMLVRLWKGSAATHGPGPMRDKNNACKGKENKVRVTRMVIIVIIVFAICWVPLQVIF